MSLFLKQSYSAVAVLIIVVSVSFFLHPIRNGMAATCCVGGGGQSVCVLPSEQKYQLGASSIYRATQGQFDAYGYYIPNGDNQNLKTLITTFGAAYRLHEDWQLSASLPVVYNDQVVVGKTGSKTGMGDPVLEGRYTLWEELYFLPYRPQLNFYGGVRFPVGTSTYNSKDSLGTDVAGEGVGIFHGGVSASKLYRPFQLSLDAGFFYPLFRQVTTVRGRSIEPYHFKPGNRIQLIESIAYLFNPTWSTSVGLKQYWHFTSSVNNSPAGGSAARLFSTLANLRYSYGENWSFALNYETIFPFYRYAANQSNFQLLGISAIYGGI